MLTILIYNEKIVAMWGINAPNLLNMFFFIKFCWFGEQFKTVAALRHLQKQETSNRDVFSFILLAEIQLSSDRFSKAKLTWLHFINRLN